MMRTQISLTDFDRQLLDAESARTGRSIAALIRDAVVRVYGPQRTLEHDVEAIDAALGAWAEHEIGGAEYVERLRSGARLAERDDS